MTDDGDPLCCCEYIDRNGERSHLCGLFCDCEDLDAAFDSWIRGVQVSESRYKRIWAAIDDRLRLPWKGGAEKGSLDLVMAPGLLWVTLTASKPGPGAFAVAHLALIGLVWIFHRKILRFRPRSKFFAAFSLSELLILFFYAYQGQIIGVFDLPKTVGFAENLLFVALISASGFCVIRVRSKARKASSSDLRFGAEMGPGGDGGGVNFELNPPIIKILKGLQWLVHSNPIITNPDKSNSLL